MSGLCNSVDGALLGRDGARVEFVNERSDAARDVLASGANLGERTALWIGEIPIEVALAGDVGALVAASHRDHDVGLLGKLACRELGLAVSEVDVKLAHDLHNLRVTVLGGRGPGRDGRVAAEGGLLEDGLAHL